MIMMDKSNFSGAGRGEERGGRCSTAKAFLDACFQEGGVADNGLWGILCESMQTIEVIDAVQGRHCPMDEDGRVICKALDAVRQLVHGSVAKGQRNQLESRGDGDNVRLYGNLENDLRACRGVLRVASDWINENHVEVDLNVGVQVIESCRDCIRGEYVLQSEGSMHDGNGRCDHELEACVVEGSLGIVGSVLRQVHGASLGKGGKELEKMVHRFVVEGALDVSPKCMPILLECAADALSQQAPQRILVEACRKCVERCSDLEDWETVEKVVKQVLACVGTLSSPSVWIKDIVKLFQRIDHQTYSMEAASLSNGNDESNEKNKLMEACVFHVGVAARRNAKIASTWMAFMKSPAWKGTPLFSMAVAFSLSSMPRFRDEIWVILKGAIMEVQDSDVEESLGLGVRLPDVLKPENRQRCVVESMIACARRFRSISIALVDFSMYILTLHDVSRDGWSFVKAQLECLLVDLFEHSCTSRQYIVSECLQACIMKGSSADSFIKVILELSRNHTGIFVKECGYQLKNGISMLHTLGPDCAAKLVSALWPALQHDGELENTIIPNMRKLVRGTIVADRLVGLKIILLYAKLKVQSTLSNSSKSPTNDSDDDEFGASQAYATMSQIEMETGSHIPMFQELLGLLRRCLCQETALRDAVYQGISELVKVDPQSRCSFAGLILPKLQWAYENLKRSGLDNFVTSEDGTNYHVAEPVGQLFLTAELVSEGEEHQKAMILRNIDTILDSICRLLYEKISESKDTQYFCADSHGQEKYMKIGLMQQVVAWATIRLSSKLKQFSKYIQSAQCMLKESILLFVSVHDELQTSALGQNLEHVYPVGKVDKCLLANILYCINNGLDEFPEEITNNPQYIAFALDITLAWINSHSHPLDKDLGQILLQAAIFVIESKSSKDSFVLCTTSYSCHTRAACRTLASCLQLMCGEVAVKDEWKRLEGLLLKLVEDQQLSAASTILHSLNSVVSKFKCQTFQDLVAREATNVWNLVQKKEIAGFCADTLLRVRLRSSCRDGRNGDLCVLMDVKNQVEDTCVSQQSATARPSLLYSNYGLVLLDTCIQHLESCLDRISYWGLKAVEIYKELTEEEVSSILSFEKDLFRRMGELAQVLVGIGALASQASVKLAQSSIHGFTLLYKTLAISAKTMMNRNEITLDHAIEFVNKIHEITPDVYSIIGEMQCLGENHDKNHQHSRVEFKELPSLIFQMEEWEKRVVHLSRKLNVNLMVNAKRTVNRDFKVKLGRKDVENLV
eukprot:jgi/Picsp_1/762/NSC_04251-R1_fanconi anemia group i